MIYTRLFADENGESHFEDIEATFKSVDFAPPAPPLDLLEFGPAEYCSLLKGPESWYGDWHPAPFRQIHFYLSGEGEAETSDGEIRQFGPGSIVLVEDTTGKGHRSRNVGSSEVIVATVKLID
jgi:quercetin dioxygenase-like cupin family protein